MGNVKVFFAANMNREDGRADTSIAALQVIGQPCSQGIKCPRFTMLCPSCVIKLNRILTPIQGPYKGNL